MHRDLVENKRFRLLVGKDSPFLQAEASGSGYNPVKFALPVIGGQFITHLDEMLSATPC